jgi:hypothetical protein
LFPSSDVAVAPPSEVGLPLKRLDREKVEASDDDLSFIIGRTLRGIFVPVLDRGEENDVTTDGAIVKDATRASVGIADKRDGSFIFLSIAQDQKLQYNSTLYLLAKGKRSCSSEIVHSTRLNRCVNQSNGVQS